MMTIEQARTELLRHSFDNFLDEPPSMAEGGGGVVVVGCPACRKRMQTINQFMHHIADDVLPLIYSHQRERAKKVDFSARSVYLFLISCGSRSLLL